MLQPSPLSSGPVPLEVNGSKLLQLIGDFLIRRRILLSAMLFIGLVARDIATGVRPHDWLNVRDPASVLGLLFIVAGLALRSWAVGILRKNRELTTTGPYRLIRNPLYVGSFLMMFGFCALMNDPHNIWVIVGPVLVIYIVKVRKEEEQLATLFPGEWPKYQAETPRFLPKLALSNVRADWKLSQWLSCREYHAILATALALVALRIWQTSPR